MKSNQIESKGILSKLLEKALKILLRKECKVIKNIQINISSSNHEIIKGEINEMKISAEEVNYKELLFNRIELQTEKLTINFQVKNKKLSFKENFHVKLKITLTSDSLQKILTSQNWGWLGCLITEKLLELSYLSDLKIENNILELKGSDKKRHTYKTELIKIESKEGKIHLKNINNIHSVIIPIEDKIYINSIKIENNQININAHSKINI